jgi:hypothetical protein
VDKGLILKNCVLPAKAGIQRPLFSRLFWTPFFNGVTIKDKNRVITQPAKPVSSDFDFKTSSGPRFSPG